MYTKMLALLLVASVLVVGCTSTTHNSDLSNSTSDVTTPLAESQPASNLNPSPPQGNLEGPFYEPFTQARYAAAQAADKTIFLEFYATWCPTCKAQKPILEKTFSELPDSSVVGFQINYNDSDVDADERALAQKFNVTLQHTHVIVDPQETVLVRGIGQWEQQMLLDKIAEAQELR